MKKKSDEENFDEAVAQVFKAYQKTTVASLFFGVPFSCLTSISGSS
jgi:hypothetical protein